MAKPTGAGSSSFELIDSAGFFREINLKAGMTFLDIACGKGAYSLAAADIIGRKGTLYALDLWEEGIRSLKTEAAAKGIRNIHALLSDASRRIPIADNAIDVCLMATVLHDFVADGIAREVLQETVRVLKPQGTLAVMEFKKKDGPPGPPLSVRLAPKNVEDMLLSYGLKQKRLADVGPYNYLLLFKRKG
jgi:ubiquinone/menaquinone biosynthesis C-methylase UbiE